MGKGFVIGFVGKPSSGKSTFFNAVTVGKEAKTAGHPFTTIKPNQGIAYYVVDCPCRRFGVQCKPYEGECHDGRRKVPVRLLDVAGLIPGAHEGLGIGNQFLDDLRHADVLVHIVDVSGKTNEKGEACESYDPSADHEWLLKELTMWIYTNLQKKMNSLRQVPLREMKSHLGSLLSGYGAPESLVAQLIDRLSAAIDPEARASSWSDADLQHVARQFVELRFPFVLALNKIDHAGGECLQNIVKISEIYDPSSIVVCSAVTECFLKKLKAQKYLVYTEGEGTFTSAQDLKEGGGLDQLKELPDERLAKRLEHVRDLVLFRYGNTGVHQAVARAVEKLDYFPVFPVRNLKTFSCGKDGGGDGGSFQTCVLVKRGTTVKGLARIVHPDIERFLLYGEAADGRRLSPQDEVRAEDNVLRLVTTRGDTPTD
eukprot:GHVU01001107.1.p1 GENE.GHVU01001107.1~~GHVU01001107.1.p1  ORF type:complete len:427 (+),score=96.48 GHVU01001107.1:2395-3675(+)